MSNNFNIKDKIVSWLQGRSGLIPLIIVIVIIIIIVIIIVIIMVRVDTADDFIRNNPNI